MGAFETWQDAFQHVVQEPTVAAPLKTASLSEDLKAWTACLTAATVFACARLGWSGAAKGHRLEILPQAGQEYLNIDVMAFPSDALGRWRLPVGAFELENHRRDDRVAYSLWKLICVRAELRFVFAFRRDWDSSRRTVDAVCRDVVGSLSVADRINMQGETALIIGNRGEGETFPWGYFKCWLLDANTGRFEKV